MKIVVEGLQSYGRPKDQMHPNLLRKTIGFRIHEIRAYCNVGPHFSVSQGVFRVVKPTLGTMDSSNTCSRSYADEDPPCSASQKNQWPKWPKSARAMAMSHWTHIQVGSQSAISDTQVH